MSSQNSDVCLGAYSIQKSFREAHQGVSERQNGTSQGTEVRMSLRKLQIVWKCQNANCTVWAGWGKKAGARARRLGIIHLFEVFSSVNVWSEMQIPHIPFSSKEAAVSLAKSVLQPPALLRVPLRHYENQAQQSPKPHMLDPLDTASSAVWVISPSANGDRTQWNSLLIEFEMTHSQPATCNWKTSARILWHKDSWVQIVQLACGASESEGGAVGTWGWKGGCKQRLWAREDNRITVVSSGNQKLKI